MELKHKFEMIVRKKLELERDEFIKSSYYKLMNELSDEQLELLLEVL